MERFAKVVNCWELLIIFAKRFVADSRQGCEYAYVDDEFQLYIIQHRNKSQMVCNFLFCKYNLDISIIW